MTASLVLVQKTVCSSTAMCRMGLQRPLKVWFKQSCAWTDSRGEGIIHGSNKWMYVYLRRCVKTNAEFIFSAFHGGLQDLSILCTDVR